MNAPLVDLSVTCGDHPFLNVDLFLERLWFCLLGLLVDTKATLRVSSWNRSIDEKHSPNDSSRDCSYSAQLDQCQKKNEVANHVLSLPLLHH